MKIAKIIVSITTIVFAVLGLTRTIPFNLSNPITLVSMATVILLRGVELKTSNNKKGFIIMLVVSLFAYTVVIYTTFLG